jgi:mannose-6-phosphate isomerase
MEPLKFYSFPFFLSFGGNRLKKNVCKFEKSADIGLLAESWEFADYKTYSSIVSDGKYKGNSLNTLLKKYKKDILGENKLLSDDCFPLMIRILDINENLPPALHPNEKYTRQNSISDHGKHETVYVLDADEGAKFYYGIKEGFELENPIDYAQNGESFSIMKEFNTMQGDCFDVAPGILHSWGKGNLIYEVHTTSNLIYAIDWLNWDKDQERRNADLEHLKNTIIPFTKKEAKINPKETINSECTILCQNDFFILEKIKLNKESKLSSKEKRFEIYTIINGSGIIESDSKKIFTIEKYETILIPASCKNVVFKPLEDTEFLKVYIPVL